MPTLKSLHLFCSPNQAEVASGLDSWVLKLYTNKSPTWTRMGKITRDLVLGARVLQIDLLWTSEDLKVPSQSRAILQAWSQHMPSSHPRDTREAEAGPCSSHICTSSICVPFLHFEKAATLAAAHQLRLQLRKGALLTQLGMSFLRAGRAEVTRYALGVSVILGCWAFTMLLEAPSKDLAHSCHLCHLCCSDVPRFLS